jgi:inosine-uridine nucleoside N-ribohydrolase
VNGYLAFKSPEVSVEAITTVFGNSSVNFSTRNALINIEQAERGDIPVAQGASKPLTRPYIGAGRFSPHGEDGLGNTNWPEPVGKVLPIPGAMLIAERIMQSPGELTLLAVGPLTNLALALNLDPRIADSVREVVVMGGALGRAVDDPIAEFNFRCDPESARQVFEAGWPLTMVGLDVTMKTEMRGDQLEQIRRADTRVARFISRITPAYLEWCFRRYHREALQVHDSAALAYLLDPSLFETENVCVDIEVRGEHTSGQSVVDRAKEANVKACRRVDSERLIRMYMDRIIT